MIRVELVGLAMLLLAAEAEEAVHGGAAVGAFDPFAARALLEACGFGGFAQRLAGAQQCCYVDAVLDGLFGGLGLGGYVSCSSRWLMK